MAYMVDMLDKEDATWRGRTIIFMDNLTSHKTHLLKELYEMLGIIVVTNAPYSPELNPIETLFGTLK
jgi:transposase